MKDFFKTFAAVVLGTALVIIGGFFLFLGSVTSMLQSGLGGATPRVPDRSVLVIDFERGIATQNSELPSLGFLPIRWNPMQGGTGFLDIVHAIETAAQDPAIRMICLKPQYLNAQMSHIEEIRNALLAFRQSGKPVISYADFYSQQAYYLSTAADKIVLNPEGHITLQGFSVNVNYYKDLFDRLGLEAQVIRHGNYKSGGEPFVASRMSDPERTQLEEYLQSVWGHWASEMDRSRHLEEGSIDLLCNRSFLTDATQALEAGLVDEIWFQDELLSYISSVYDGIPENRIPKAGLQDYIQYSQLNTKKFPSEKIALIYATGEIVLGKGSEQVSAEAYAEQLRKYRNDSTVKAVVIRVESPGGDPLAAAIISKELELTKDVKPVIVSMGDMGASGGYWIASPADEIYVNPSTLTGSIGVYSISFNGEKTMNELLNIRNETVDTHPFSHFDSYYHRKSKREMEIIGEQVEASYNRFLDVVSQNRGMDKQTVEGLADGRIWSGTDAIAKGLADQKGGLADAIRDAALKAGVADYRLTVYPKPFRILDLINMSGRKVMADPQAIIRRQIQDLLGERELQARLPFDEKALSW